MAKILDTVMPYAMGCESRRYIGCFASLAMCMEQYDGSQPTFCCQRHDFCIACGKCGPINPLQRKHEELYHLYVTVSGMGVLYFDPALSSLNHDEVAETLLRDAAAMTMNYAGYACQTFTHNDPEDAVRHSIIASIDNGIPVIIRTSRGNCNIIAGYGEDGAVLYGFNGYGTYLGALDEPTGYTDGNMFYTRDWFRSLSAAFVVTGRTQPMASNNDVFRRLIAILQSQRSEGSGNALFRILEDDSLFARMSPDELRRIYDFTNGLIGYLAEARCFVHEAFATAFLNSITDPAVRDTGYEISELCLNSHDTAWIPWRAIGAWDEGDHTGRLRDAEIRRGVIAGLKKIIHNDTQVRGKLEQCVQ